MSYYPNRRIIQVPDSDRSNIPNLTSFNEGIFPANIISSNYLNQPTFGREDFPSFSSPPSYSTSPRNIGVDYCSPLINRKYKFDPIPPTYVESQFTNYSPSNNRWASAREIPIIRDEDNVVRPYSPEDKSLNVREIPIELANKPQCSYESQQPSFSNRFRHPNYFMDGDINDGIIDEINTFPGRQDGGFKSSPRSLSPVAMGKFQQKNSSPPPPTRSHQATFSNRRNKSPPKQHHRVAGNHYNPNYHATTQRSNSPSPPPYRTYNQTQEPQSKSPTRQSPKLTSSSPRRDYSELEQQMPSLSKVIEIPIVTAGTNRPVFNHKKTDAAGDRRPNAPVAPATNIAFDNMELNEGSNQPFNYSSGERARQIPIQVVKEGSSAARVTIHDPLGPRFTNTYTNPITPPRARSHQRNPTTTTTTKTNDGMDNKTSGNLFHHHHPDRRPSSSATEIEKDPSSFPTPPPAPKKVEKTAPEIVRAINENLEKEIIPAIRDLSEEELREKGSSKEFLRLDDSLTKCLLDLDAIDAGDDDSVRTMRREAVHKVNDCINKLESKVRVVRDRKLSAAASGSTTESSSQKSPTNFENGTGKALKTKEDSSATLVQAPQPSSFTSDLNPDDKSDLPSQTFSSSKDKLGSRKPKGVTARSNSKKKNKDPKDEEAFSTPPSEMDTEN